MFAHHALIIICSTSSLYFKSEIFFLKSNNFFNGKHILYKKMEHKGYSIHIQKVDISHQKGEETPTS